MHSDLAKTIDDAFEKRNDISPSTKGPVREAVEAALDLLDRGKARVAERSGNGAWTVNQWLKKAVLLSFRLTDSAPMAGGEDDQDLRHRTRRGFCSSLSDLAFGLPGDG